MMDWIKKNGKWVHISKLLNEQRKLETNRNKLIKEIKSTNKNTSISQLKKTVNKFEKVQKEISNMKLKNKQTVSCIVKGHGLVRHLTKSECKLFKGQLLK